jgi:methylglutaconyl-CoA hydratase
MSDKVLITDINPRGAARLTMNRPEVRNAFNEELIDELEAAVRRLAQDPHVRAIVLAGEGETFSAGADVEMMRRIANYSAAQNKKEARRLARMFAAIYEAPKPVIARVNGPAMGGGVGLVAACDIAIGAENAFFALSEARLGIIPAVIAPFVIEAIGARQARRFFLTGERFDAATAKKIGLLHIATPPDALDAALDEVLANLLACGPKTAHEAKSLIRKIAHEPMGEGVLEVAADIVARLRASEEGREGLGAFLEKRKPDWIKDA